MAKAIINIFKFIVISIAILLIALLSLELTRALARTLFQDADGGAIIGFLGGISLSFLVWRLLKK